MPAGAGQSAITLPLLRRDTSHMLRVAMLAVLAAIASPSIARASCDLGMLRMYTLTSGHLAGTTWRLRAIDSGDGRYAFDIMIGGSRRAHHSGRFYVKGPNGTPVELGFASSSPGTRRSDPGSCMPSTPSTA